MLRVAATFWVGYNPKYADPGPLEARFVVTVGVHVSGSNGAPVQLELPKLALREPPEPAKPGQRRRRVVDGSWPVSFTVVGRDVEWGGAFDAADPFPSLNILDGVADPSGSARFVVQDPSFPSGWGRSVTAIAVNVTVKNQMGSALATVSTSLVQQSDPIAPWQGDTVANSLITCGNALTCQAWRQTCPRSGVRGHSRRTRTLKPAERVMPTIRW